jgi:nitronate monooxygenase
MTIIQEKEIFPLLEIGDIKTLPIIQGGMGVGISLAGLASAVARQKCIGVISAAMIGIGEPDIRSNTAYANIRALKREIRKAREATDGILGVNIMVAMTHFPELVLAAIEEKIDIIFAGAGLPLDLPKYLKNGSTTKLVPIVSSARAANLICKKWLSKFGYTPDAVVVEGPKAGGHLGFKPEQIENPDYSLEKITMEVIETLRPFKTSWLTPIPVIVAGGIYTGKDVFDFFQLGAAGVQMGTRFVATHECDADIAFKKAFIEAKKEDLVVIQSPVGMPGRAINNSFLASVVSGGRKPFKCSYHCVKTCQLEKSPYCIALALAAAKKGNFKNGFAFAGKNAYRIDKLLSVAELINSLKEEYAVACNDATQSQMTECV